MPLPTDGRLRAGATGAGQRLRAAAFGGLQGLVLWSPLPLASNRGWAAALLALGVAVLLLMVAAAHLAGAGRPWRRLREARLPLLLLSAFAAIPLCQLWPWHGRALSADPFGTRQYLLLSVTYLGAFALVLVLADSPRRARRLAMVLFASAAVQACMAIALHAAQARYRLFYFELDHTWRALGTFSYHNSLANYLLIGIALGFGVLAGDLSAYRNPGRGWRRRAAGVLALALSPVSLRRGLLAVMIIALVLTRSRMGNAALLGALTLVGLPAALSLRRLRRGAGWLLVSMLAVDVVVIGHWVGLERVAARLTGTALTPEAAGDTQESVARRAGPAGYALAMLRERPLLGFGGGTFYTAYPRYNGPDYRQYYDHAHNDYVEIAADTGLTGLGLLGALTGATVWRAWRVLRRPARLDAAGIALGALIAITAVLAQAAVDFHFQIPANALAFVILAALVWTLRPGPRRGGSQPPAAAVPTQPPHIERRIETP